MYVLVERLKDFVDIVIEVVLQGCADKVCDDCLWSLGDALSHLDGRFTTTIIFELYFYLSERDLFGCCVSLFCLYRVALVAVFGYGKKIKRGNEIEAIESVGTAIME